MSAPSRVIVARMSMQVAWKGRAAEQEVVVRVRDRTVYISAGAPYKGVYEY